MEQSELNNALLKVFTQASLNIDFEKGLELLNLGADPLWVQDETGESPLYMVCSRHQLRGDKKAIITALVEKGLSLSYTDAYGFTALHNVAYKGALSELNTLLKLGANVNLQDNKGHTPLYLACISYSSSKTKAEERKIFRLLESGADINVQNVKGVSALNILSRCDASTVEKVEAYISKKESESSGDRESSVSTIFRR